MKKKTRSLITLVLFVLCLCGGVTQWPLQAQTAPSASAGQSNTLTGIVLLVSDSGGNKIHVYDAVTGETLYDLGTNDDPIQNPTGIAIGPDRLLYVASSGNSKILRFDLNVKRYKDTIGSCSNGIQFQFDARSNPLVLTYYPSNIYTYSTGAFTPFLTGSRPIYPSDMTHGADQWLYVTDTQGVHKYNPATGADSRTFISKGTGGLSGPSGLTFGPDGNLYVADAGTNMIKEFSTTGQYVANFVTDNHLSSPGHLRFGPDGNLYVINSRIGNVLEFQGPTGAMPGTFVKIAVEAGQGGLRRPNSLTFLSTVEPALGAPSGSTAADLAQTVPGTNRAPISSLNSGVVPGAQSPLAAPLRINATGGHAVAKTSSPATANARAAKAPTPAPQKGATTPKGNKMVTPAPAGNSSPPAKTKKAPLPPAPKPAPLVKTVVPSPPANPKH